MWSYAAEVFWAVLPRKSFLKLKALSHAPELAYRNAPPAPYKGMLLQCVHTPQEMRKQLQTDQNHVNASTGKFHRCRGGGTVAECRCVHSIPLGIYPPIECSAYLFIHCHLQCSYSAFIYVRTSRWLGLVIITINVKHNC